MPGDFSVSDRVHISAKFVGFVRVTVGVLTFNTFFIQLYSPPESNNFPRRSTRRVFNGGESNLTWHVAIKLIQRNLSN